MSSEWDNDEDAFKIRSKISKQQISQPKHVPGEPWHLAVVATAVERERGATTSKS